jgi:hypothetical protein
MIQLGAIAAMESVGFGNALVPHYIGIEVTAGQNPTAKIINYSHDHDDPDFEPPGTKHLSDVVDDLAAIYNAVGLTNHPMPDWELLSYAPIGVGHTTANRYAYLKNLDELVPTTPGPPTQPSNP